MPLSSNLFVRRGVRPATLTEPVYISLYVSHIEKHVLASTADLPVVAAPCVPDPDLKGPLTLFRGIPPFLLDTQDLFN